MEGVEKMCVFKGKMAIFWKDKSIAAENSATIKCQNLLM